MVEGLGRKRLDEEYADSLSTVEQLASEALAKAQQLAAQVNAEASKVGTTVQANIDASATKGKKKKS
jgi:hypothetical protein